MVDALHRQAAGGAEPRRADRAHRGRSTGCSGPSTTGSPNWYQADAPRRPLGHLRLAREQARLRLHAGNDLVVRPRQGDRDRHGRIGRADGRLHPPPPALYHPDDHRDHGDQLRRGAVRAGRPGRADHRPAPGHRRLGDGAHQRAAAATSRACPIRAAPAAARSPRNIAARRGSTRNSSSQLEVQFGFDKPPVRALRPDAVELHPLRFRRELFPRHQRHRPDRREDAGVDLARPVDDAPLLPDLDPARHPQGDAGRLALRHLDERA